MHSFYIPVLGLGYTAETPLKVAKFGINSVVSINHDGLLEDLRAIYSKKEQKEYHKITDTHPDKRAERIRLFLNLSQEIVDKQFFNLKEQALDEQNDLKKYIDLLPLHHPICQKYREYQQATPTRKTELELELKNMLVSGKIDVNIMTKADRSNYTKSKEVLPPLFSDAMAALRGYATSTINSSLVLSAGMNPRLFTYIEDFTDFYPDTNGEIKKKIILKVSDYRSASIQGVFLARKGIWVSEFRIESGLNCGGHAFPTEGLLMGPILQEFKDKIHELENQLFDECNKCLELKQRPKLKTKKIALGAQGGIGTAEEDTFLRENYALNASGWGSPFLLVPEAVTIDADTVQRLCNAKKEDYYLSYASPFGIPFNNLRTSASNELKRKRVDDGKPGSPCYYKHLAFDTEYAEEGWCTASRRYQNKKSKEINASNLSEEEKEKQLNKIYEKECLCSGLLGATLDVNEIDKKGKYDAIAICPGPNLAYFNKVASLQEMVNHIYGKQNLLNSLNRKHMFINELEMYIEYYNKAIQEKKDDAKNIKYLNNFKKNLELGIQYYHEKLPFIFSENTLTPQDYLSILN